MFAPYVSSQSQARCVPAPGVTGHLELEGQAGDRPDGRARGPSRPHSVPKQGPCSRSVQRQGLRKGPLAQLRKRCLRCSAQRGSASVTKTFRSRWRHEGGPSAPLAGPTQQTPGRPVCAPGLGCCSSPTARCICASVGLCPVVLCSRAARASCWTLSFWALPVLTVPSLYLLYNSVNIGSPE